jgi:hypothetical protein
MHLSRLLACLFLMCAIAHGQSVSASLKGRVVDPAKANIAGAAALLSHTETGARLKAATNADGLFVFPAVAAGAYDLEIEATGFQTSQTRIELTISEIRDLGEIVLTIGQVRQAATVVDTPVSLQVASGEKSGLVSGEQLNELALKGRDFFSLMILIPGVVDTSDSRETTANTAIDGIYINGARTDMKHFTVDGIGTVDTGSNNSIHYQPNMDSIAEVKVLTSNYQAEYGRSAGGVISVVTKGGGREFRGTGWGTFRNEALNANSFFNNKTAIDKPAYRYLIGGYSLGGPVYFPKRFNTDRSRLFFFVSQEYTRRQVDSGAVYANMPTPLEREGDFSKSVNTNGTPITITDPLTKQNFPGAVIPRNRFNPIGQSILKFFPLPNYVDPDPAQVYRRNYKAAASGAHPRRNDMVRIDSYPFSKVNAYFRWIRDFDDQELPFNGFTNFLYSPFMHPNPGHGYAGHLTYTARPTLVNEFSIGKSWVSWQYRPKEPEKVKRGVIGDIPQWFPNVPTTNDPSDLVDSLQLPNMSFGGTPVNPPAISINNKQHINSNDTMDIANNLMWVRGKHNVKTGVYIHLNGKVQVQSMNWNGTINFGVDTNNPFNTKNSFSNALLGYFNTYSESSLGGHFNGKYWTTEFFVQDNWRVKRGLTLDCGVRFYHLAQQVDRLYSISSFFPDRYDPRKAPVLYWPGFDSKGNRVAMNPQTGETASSALIGLFVPGSGDFANGMGVAGKNGDPAGVVQVPLLTAAPRLGFAYDPSARGRMVIRGGVGVFIDRSRQLINTNTINNPPVAYTPTAYYGNLDTFTQSGGAIGPSTIRFAFPDSQAKYPSVMSYSFGVQRMLPARVVIDVSYVGNVSRHLLQARNLNPIPMYARFDPANQDPTQPGKPLPDNFFRLYPGIGDLITYEFAASANYNSLQTQVQRRMTKGLRFGAAYTWAKALGVANTYDGAVSPYFKPRQRNYGPLNFDRTHTLALNYMYTFPKPGKALRNPVLTAVADDWTISGVTTFVSGPPFTPSFTTAANSDVTGSTESAVITVAGNPRLDKSEKTFGRNFNTDAFAATPKSSFGNGGVNILRKPGINNWDISLSKSFNIGLGEKRLLTFRAESYNTWNHTQFTNLDSTGRYDAQGMQTSLSFGAFTAARPGRVVSFALRFRF